MRDGIRAVAFDLDGTLYPNSSLYWRLIPFVIKELRFMTAFSKARNIFHASPGQGKELAGIIAGANGDFYADQAAVTANLLGAEPEYIQQKLEKCVYRGWEPHFKKVRLFKYAVQAIQAFRAAGLKLGLLSDFPPETKIKNLGIETDVQTGTAYWDSVLCTEVIGALKPDPLSFFKLADTLQTAPSQILYVGNSYHYDVVGAKNAGMMAALIDRSLHLPCCFLSKKYNPRPDFIFHDYRQLIDFVLS